MTVQKRGKPDHDSMVHMYRSQKRLGMPEDGNVLCLNGSFHIFFTDDDPKAVTCPKCLEAMDTN